MRLAVAAKIEGMTRRTKDIKEHQRTLKHFPVDPCVSTEKRSTEKERKRREGEFVSQQQ